jgi:GT2 family glycosyltransferase
LSNAYASETGDLKNRYPTVSIIIVNYNGYEWLQLCLPSLLETSYPNFEIIVVDNHSTDESVRYMKLNWHDCVQIIELKKNLGFAEGCNIGIREAHGDIIAILNNDLEVDKNWLRASVETLLNDRRAGLVQPKIMQYGEKNRIDSLGLSVDRFGICVQIGHGEIDHGQYDYLSEIWASDGAAMIVWKNILMKVGLFDPTFFMYYEDVDLSWRIRLSGYKNTLAQSSLVYHARSSTANTVPSSLIIFHGTKNLITSWLKNYSLRTLIINFPILTLLLTGSLVVELKKGRYNLLLARIKSGIWVLKNLNYIFNERQRVQRLIRQKDMKDSTLFMVANRNKPSNLMYLLKRSLR